MMRVIPFDFEHLDLFEQRDDDVARYGKKDSSSAIPLAQHGTAFTGIYDGRILVMGGIMLTSNHTGKCWTMVSKYAAEYGAMVFRATKRMIDMMMADMHLHRLETVNLKDAPDQLRWCKLLGFVEEGEMPYYDDEKRTHIRMAKIRG